VRQDVESRLIPGAVMLIARGGRIGFVQAIGFRYREAGTPMNVDTIFRIASMTKAISSVTAMILAEQGELQIAAPVAVLTWEYSHSVDVLGASSRSSLVKILDWVTPTRLDDHDRLRFPAIRQPQNSGTEKRVRGPPPRPSMPAIRQAILDLFARSPPRQCPHCKKLLVEKLTK
jgi:hypothetical protein